MNKLPAKVKPKKLSKADFMIAQLQELQIEMLKLRSDLVTTFHDECCHKRQTISRELGQRLINKLEAEDKARRHTLGEL